MTDLTNIKLYATQPHACSYLPGEEATSIFVDPNQTITPELYSALSERGFRRSGKHIYSPHCHTCSACIPARIPVQVFRQNRRQRKCWNRNQDLTVSIVRSIDSPEHYQLYARYIAARHSDGDMFPPSEEQYSGFLTSEWGVTAYLEFRHQQRLIAVAVADRMNDGYSAVYTFYDPDEEKRSLGMFAILWQIAMTAEEHLSHVYLGYWIKQCQKMRYKSEYRPLELLIDHRWLRMN
ncbi:arginyltransferase [Pseudomaricurvus sp. HS19]|uniref:arginyltransferase n=1 Tax=Pseudomaricurvus sp. HS19 TaxID=2692626 RepID=UPI00136C73E0|nr:arginyltransferase [Pseudomaricurvus sp. HS19]MYM62223.1 arginyltransferase [Pseudomaricurvus sp. HS19]